MYKSNKQLSLAIMILLISLVATSVTVFARPSLATSPTLNVLLEFSVLGGQEVTNTLSPAPDNTTLEGAVGVSPGTSITGFPPGTASDIYISGIDPIADNAQAEALSVYGALDQTCTQDWSGGGVIQLGGMNLEPGVYCADSFALTGTLTLTGGAEEVYIFKTPSTLITAAGSSVEGGDPCNVWWRVAENATLGTNSSFIGNVFSAGASDSAMQTGATLAGRFIGLSSVTITLDENNISMPVCLVQETTPTPAPTSEPSESTPEPETLPDTGGDLAGPGSQIIRVSLGALGLTLILFGFMLNRRTQKTER